MSMLEKLLIKHEGLVLKPYRDTVGKLTIGVGHNLDDNGISRAIAMRILEDDINAVVHELMGYPWFVQLDDVRQDAITDMGFNMGVPTLLEFQKMIACLERKDFSGAVKEAMDSRWARQVGHGRSGDITHMLMTGEYPE